MRLPGILQSWWGELTRPRRDTANTTTIDSYVTAAIASAETAMGRDESFGDIVGRDGVADFRTREASAVEQFFIVRDALATLAKGMRQDDFADPVVVAAMQLFCAEDGDGAEEKARHIIALHVALLDLPIATAARPQPKGRGRPTRSPVARAAVRGAMHWLSDQGHSYTADWDYTDRKAGRGAKRSRSDELLPKNHATTQVLAAVRRAGIQVEISEIRAHMIEYKSLLNQDGGRLPRLEDYNDGLAPMSSGRI